MGVGSPWAFEIAVMVILIWALTGPLFHFSDTWQLVINTGTTIVTSEKKRAAGVRSSALPGDDVPPPGGGIPA